MSYSGKLTPLGINVLTQLEKNSVFSLALSAKKFQGTWAPSSYIQGEIVTQTVLNKITLAIKNFYELASNQITSVNLYRNLIKIGRPINIQSDDRINCPALGNCRPDSFKTTYAGYGTWDYKVVDEFGNTTVVSNTLNIVNDTYPPVGYPSSGKHSYVYNLWGSTEAGSYQHEHQWNHPYGWITGWPARNTFQKELDSYSIAYFPRPDIRQRDQNLIEYDEYFKNGFIATIARQAYYELWSDHTARRINQYAEIVKSFQQTHIWKQSKNSSISSLVNSKSFLRGNYSNMNDLTTSDIAGVTLSFKLFGNDMIRLGKSLDMSNIHKFGLPSKFLLNLQSNKAITDSIKLALLYTDLTTIELDKIFGASYTPTVDQEKKIWTALDLIRGNDLNAVKLILNCTTENLTSLVDLMNPKKMFPTSYKTLTIPKYDINNPGTSKIYDFIYIEDSVNTRIQNWGEYLSGIVADDLSLACGAFMMTMNQIKNIRLMNTEKLAQTIANLEVVDKALPLINSADGSTVNISDVNENLSKIALGSGSNGTYKQTDFFGAVSAVPYEDYYQKIIESLKAVSTESLKNVYEKIYQKSLNNGWALISRGRGYLDTVINPSTQWDSKYTYTLFSTVNTHEAGENSILLKHDLRQILPNGTKISFNFNGYNAYTVLNTNFDGLNTVVTLTTQLTEKINNSSLVYVEETEYEISVQNLIDAANLEILKISTLNVDTIDKLNYYWNKIGEQLSAEQRALAIAIPNNDEVFGTIDGTEFETFVKSVYDYATQTEYGEAVSVLEAIADTSTLGGQSLVAMMRETRNANRILNVGGELDNDIPDSLNLNNATAEACQLNESGGISSITVTSAGSGYSDQQPPAVRIGPYGGVFGGAGSGAIAEAVVEGSRVTKINVVNGGGGYSTANGCIPVIIDPPPVSARLGDTTVPGSFAGSPWTGNDPVPDHLVTTDDSSYTVEEAIENVTQCNCDCWNN
jgi:hypothetical protein